MKSNYTIMNIKRENNVLFLTDAVK